MSIKYVTPLLVPGNLARQLEIWSTGPDVHPNTTQCTAVKKVRIYLRTYEHRHAHTHVNMMGSNTR